MHREKKFKKLLIQTIEAEAIVIREALAFIYCVALGFKSNMSGNRLLHATQNSYYGVGSAMEYSSDS